MANISINGRIFNDIQLIAFDKDGTLIDFHHLWGEKSRQWIDWLVQHGGKGINGRHKLFLDLCHSFGFDAQTNRIINDSPLAVASMPKLYTIPAVVLYQNGLGWDTAEQIVQESLLESLNALPAADLLQPIGNVSHTMERLTLAGIRIAIITSDDRAATEASLPVLGITNFVDLLICGDDNVPNKPAPEALWAISQQLNIKPLQMLMVGDTASDMIFGRNAGIGGLIGIRGGAGEYKALAAAADEVVDTIESILVAGSD